MSLLPGFRRFRTLALSLGLTLFMSGIGILGGAQAQTMARPIDALAVQAVVRGQLEAFQKNDPVKAFTYASSGVKATFENNPVVFGKMVQTQYPMVYRPKSFKFEQALELQEGGGGLVQSVLIESQQGETVRAVYLLIKEAGAWKVGGVFLAPLEEDETPEAENIT